MQTSTEADSAVKKFKARHLIFAKVIEFTEQNAPSWLTSANTKAGSTLDNRWFWIDHVLTLGVGKAISTDFWRITRTA